MKGMEKKGYMQGDMNPTVSDYQRPNSSFAESQFGTTTEYVARQDKQINRAASDIRKQSYKGRYE